MLLRFIVLISIVAVSVFASFTIMFSSPRSTAAATPVLAAPPETPRRKVVDAYHGEQVADEYRWLEDGAAAEVVRWSEAQNAHARKHLDHLPGVAAIRARVSEIMLAKTFSYVAVDYVQGRLFAIKREPPRQQPFLVTFIWPGDLADERVLVDPNLIDPSGGASIDWHEPSPDGTKVAVSLSRGGSEAGDVHLFDVASGRDLGEVVPRVNGGTAGGSLSWAADGSGFFYSRYPREGERPTEDLDFYTQVYFHRLGTPTTADRYEIGADFPRIAEIKLATAKSGHVLATVQNGDGGEFELFLRSLDGAWTQISRYEDQIVAGAFSRGDSLYVISRRGAPRGEVLRLPLAKPTLANAVKVVAQGEDAIVSDFSGPTSLVATDTRIYVEYQTGGPSEIRAFDEAGRPQSAPKQAPVSTAGGMIGLAGDSLLYNNVSFVAASAWYHFDPQSGATEKTALATPAVVAFDDVEVVREFAVSADGTRVPLSIILPKSAKRDGKNACVVTGYGGYGICLSPSFRPLGRVMAEHGVISVVANLRGGGEYGDAWHRAGNLTKKQNVFDDFAAVLRHLVDRGYTSADRLAIIGGSNGGLLMGATLTQHPELMTAVVSSVGIYDMLRVERSPNGAFNIPEFGSVNNAAQFRALHAYSPYHHVRDGGKYPAILMMTGANDPRVDPMQSRKMTARMQTASPATTVLLRTSANTGHGIGTPLAEQIEEQVDVHAFLFDRLGVKVRGS